MMGWFPALGGKGPGGAEQEGQARSGRRGGQDLAGFLDIINTKMIFFYKLKTQKS
jgi:hypothetical protein